MDRQTDRQTAVIVRPTRWRVVAYSCICNGNNAATYASAVFASVRDSVRVA